jgi:ABC-type multidrug transport system fused ATPase/permease subunit
MIRPPPRFRFGLLQAVAFSIGLGGLYLYPPVAILLLWPGTMVAGVIFAVKGFGRAVRNGIGEGRFVVRLVASLVLGMVAWLLLLGIVAEALDVGSLAFGLAFIWTPMLGVFSAGSLAYLGLGPFRSRLAAMERVRQILADGRTARIGLRATSDQIAEAERTLGLRLPISFREFLSTWGQIEFGSTRVLGITAATDAARSTDAGFVAATIEARRTLGLSPHFILCVTHPNNLHVCLDTFSMRNEEGPAVLWNSSVRVVTLTLAPTFADFLRDQLEAAIK